jgi:hypothetical protein
MLLLNSRVLEIELDGRSRLGLLDRLQEKSLTPLIRSSRQHCYRQALLSEDRARELEHIVADWHDSNNDAPYLCGDVICRDDHVLFLNFVDAINGKPGLTAGIIYEPDTKEPLWKLDSFCQLVQDTLSNMHGVAFPGNDSNSQEMFDWRPAPSAGQRGLDRMLANIDRDAISVTVRQESTVARIRGAEFLEDVNARDYLKRAFQIFNEGASPLLLSGETESMPDFSVEQMINAGLLKQEVLVSCRKTGHTIFRLPSADALAVVTVSEATCSECGTLIADEKVEDAHAPTRLANALLEEGSWLVTRIHALLRELGLPESEIAIAPSVGDGNAHIFANVCGESFLFVLRDGDLTPSLARRAIDLSLETQATQLIVVATGTIQNEGRVRLNEYVSRRTRRGETLSVLILQGAATATSELPQIFERVSQQVIARELCELDANIGFNLSRMIITRSQLIHKTNLALVASS